MSDNRELDEIMEPLTIIPNEEAKQKAKALFLKSTMEVMHMDEKKQKQRFWRNKQIINSFIAGIAAMLILVVGVTAAVNPGFLTGAVAGVAGSSASTTYVDANGKVQTVSAVPLGSGDTSTTMRNGWYVTTTAALKNASLSVYSGYTANLIIADGTTFSVAGSYAGINVPNGAILNIYAQSGGTGVLTATGNTFGAGIGGGNYWDAACGTINIYGGIINATGARNGSGIGGGNSNPCGTVNIYSGTINATGGDAAAYGGGGAGIGGGNNAPGNSGTVNIYGGNVTATGGTNIIDFKTFGYGAGAGIGGGCNGNGGIINIAGGTVTAEGGHEIITPFATGGAGIGSGFNGGGRGDAGIITISGGKVSATGGWDGGAGIGCGPNGNKGNITILDGSVIAAGGQEATGIGVGAGHDNPGGNGIAVTIKGGAIIAAGGFNSVGIGGGSGNRCNVTICGGMITARGGNYYEGIGNGIGGISITGGCINPMFTGNISAPKDGSGNAVRLVTIFTPVKNTAITSISSPSGYGIKDVMTDADGKLYFYLPGGSTDISLVASGITYSGTATIANNNQTVLTLTEPLVSTAYIDARGNLKNMSATKITSDYFSHYSSIMNSGWYVTTTATFDNGSFTVAADATVNLIIADGTTFDITGRDFSAGINVPSGAMLNIYGQSGGTGVLKATGGQMAAAIGGNDDHNCGNVTINSGVVIANSGSWADAIGGDGGTVVITGGVVTATGDRNNVGIGGNGGAVTITGGSVNTTGYLGNGGGSWVTNSVTLKNGSGTDIHLVTLTVGLTPLRDTAITSMTAPAGYGIKGVKTDANGKLYFYLPAGSTDISLVASGVTYSGTVTITNDDSATLTLTAK